MAFEKIQGRLGAHAGTYSIQAVRDAVEQTVVEIYDRHIRHIAAPKPDISLLAGTIQSQDNRMAIIKTDRKAVVTSDETFEIVGAGDVLEWHMSDQLDPLWGSSLSVADGALFAAYILRLAKRYVSGCGGYSAICKIESGLVSWLRNIDEIEGRLAQWESAIAHLFFAIPDMQILREHFEEKLVEFSERLRHLRTEWEGDPLRFE